MATLTRLTAAIRPAMLALSLPVVLTYLLWALWLFDIASTVSGAKGLYFGRQIGNDFFLYHTAGRSVLEKNSAQLYQRFADHDHYRYFGYNRPPAYALLLAPFAALPLTASFLLWSALGIVALWMGVRPYELQHPGRVFLLALGWFPVWCAISFGQTILPTFAVISLTFWLWRRRHQASAGLVLSFALDKPHLALGIGLLWLLRWPRDNWALGGLAAGAMALTGISFAVMPEASWAYLARLPEFGRMMYHPQFPIDRMQSVDSFFYLWLRPNLSAAMILTGLTKAVGMLGAVWLWRRHQNSPALLFAVAMLLTFWLSPYLLIYDAVLLLIPGLLLSQQLPQKQWGWKILFSIYGVIVLLGWPLVAQQLAVSQNALNINVLAFLLGSAYLFWRLTLKT